MDLSYNWLLSVPPTAGRLVVKQCVSREPHPLSAVCEFCRAGTLPGALLASCRGNSPGEGQYLHLVHAAVLESYPHVRCFLCCFYCVCVGQNLTRSNFPTRSYVYNVISCYREKLAPHKAGNTPLDMDQFRMLYCTCKVPGVKKDSVHNYFKTGRKTSTQFVYTSIHCEGLTQFTHHCCVMCVLFHRERRSMPLPFGCTLSWTCL